MRPVKRTKAQIVEAVESQIRTYLIYPEHNEYCRCNICFHAKLDELVRLSEESLNTLVF